MNPTPPESSRNTPKPRFARKPVAGFQTPILSRPSSKQVVEIIPFLKTTEDNRVTTLVNVLAKLCKKRKKMLFVNFSEAKRVHRKETSVRSLDSIINNIVNAAKSDGFKRIRRIAQQRKRYRLHARFILRPLMRKLHDWKVEAFRNLYFSACTKNTRKLNIFEGAAKKLLLFSLIVIMKNRKNFAFGKIRAKSLKKRNQVVSSNFKKVFKNVLNKAFINIRLKAVGSDQIQKSGGKNEERQGQLILEIESLKAEILVRDQHINKLEIEATNLNKELTKSKKQIKQLQSKMKIKEKDIQMYKKEVDEAKSITKEVNELKRRNKELEVIEENFKLNNQRYSEKVFSEAQNSFREMSVRQTDKSRDSSANHSFLNPHTMNFLKKLSEKPETHKCCKYKRKYLEQIRIEEEMKQRIELMETEYELIYNINKHFEESLALSETEKNKNQYAFINKLRENVIKLEKEVSTLKKELQPYKKSAQLSGRPPTNKLSIRIQQPKKRIQEKKMLSPSQKKTKLELF